MSGLPGDILTVLRHLAAESDIVIDAEIGRTVQVRADDFVRIRALGRDAVLKTDGINLPVFADVARIQGVILPFRLEHVRGQTEQCSAVDRRFIIDAYADGTGGDGEHTLFEGNGIIVVHDRVQPDGILFARCGDPIARLIRPSILEPRVEGGLVGGVCGLVFRKPRIRDGEGILRDGLAVHYGRIVDRDGERPLLHRIFVRAVLFRDIVVVLFIVRVVECGGKGILRAAVMIAEFSVERNEQADPVARFEVGIFRFDFFALVGAVVGEGIFRPEDLCLCFFDEHGKRTRRIVVVCRGDDIVDGVRDGRAFRIHFDVFEEGGGRIVYGERPVRFLTVYGGRIAVHVVQNHPVFAVVGERKVL